MKYIVYLLVAALAAWSVWYLVRTIRRQLKGGCDCGCGCRDCSRDGCRDRGSGRRPE